ncbi:Sulfotransferase family protein [Frateuria terrea]|uniref:Sulfotransferase family protein n=2 Tax=Frateuria terrea TaxID=529704 RepID=A0A1H6SR33_9GAMM|nr:Sulfotransferase family protein [Frateuria terrea]SFP27566.1 Sulfotransferase family protein [Frateuria terrea]
MDDQDWQGAQTVLEAIVRQAPNDLASSIRLADTLFRQGQLQASTRPLLQAMRCLPRDAPLITDLTQHLIARGQTNAARACLDMLEQAPNPPAPLRVVQANLRLMLGQFREALALIEKAVEAGADGPGEMRLHGMLLHFNGRSEAACSVLEECLRRWPQYGEAAATLVDLRKQRPDVHRLPQLLEQLQLLPERPEDPGQALVRAEFEYAVFKTLDDLDRPEQAWQALSRCNALMHRLNPYRADMEEATVDALVHMTLPRQGTAEPVRPEGPTPIFIVGMPRSGTTLLDRILSSHSQVASAGEIVDFWRQLHWVADVVPANDGSLLRIARQGDDIDFEQLGLRYLKQTQWMARGRRFYVDKLPGNIQLVAFIRRALPHAPVLHMVRDPMDTCFSNFKAMFGNISPYSYDLKALAHYYLLYTRLVKHWHETLPGAMLDVSYASLVRSPETVVRQVLSHCGLEVEEACLRPERNADPVATRSSAQVRESIHMKGLGRWRDYALQLEPLREALAAGGCSVTSLDDTDFC